MELIKSRVPEPFDSSQIEKDSKGRCIIKAEMVDNPDPEEGYKGRHLCLTVEAMNMQVELRYPQETVLDILSKIKEGSKNNET